MTNLTLYNGSNYAFTLDRNNVANRAISLTSGYLQAPSSVYFTGGDYTVMAWVYPRQFTYNARLIDFGNGQEADNLVFSFTSGSSGKPYNCLVKGNTWPLQLYSVQALQLNQWNHVAFIFSSSTKNASIYLNGSSIANKTSSEIPNNVVRSSNYIGKSNWAEANANAIFDELKIFSIALTQSQIRFEMTNEWFSSPSISTSSLYSFYFLKKESKSSHLYFEI